MKAILPLLLVVLAIGGAGFGAMTLRKGDAAPAHAADKGHDSAKSKGGGHGEAKGSDKKGVHEVKGDDATPETAFFDFSRNFLIPVMEGSSVGAIALVNVSVEIPYAAQESVKSREPRIRDAFMKSFLALSHEGYFAADITDPNVYETIQTRLMETAKATVDPEVRSVLIIDFSRQDQ